MSVDSGTTLTNAYYVYYTNGSGTNSLRNGFLSSNNSPNIPVSIALSNLPSLSDGTTNYHQLFIQYAESGTLWFAITTNAYMNAPGNPAATAGPGVPWNDAPFGDIEYAYTGSPYDTADTTAINTVGLPMVLQLCTNVNAPVPATTSVSYVKGFTNPNAIPTMLGTMGEISSTPWFGAAPNTNLIRFVGPSGAQKGGIQMANGGSTNANPLYNAGWPGQVAPSFAPYIYNVWTSPPIATNQGVKVWARISNAIGLNGNLARGDPTTNQFFYRFSFDLTFATNTNAPAPSTANLNWLRGITNASNTPYYWTPVPILTNGVIIASNKISGVVTTNTGLGARYTPDGGSASNSWFSSYIYGAPSTYSAPNSSGSNTGYVTLLPNVAAWSNIAASNGFSYHSSWAPSIQDSMLNEISFGFAGGFVKSPILGWPIWVDANGDNTPPGGAPISNNPAFPQTNVGAMASASWWVQPGVYQTNQPSSPALINNPWFSAWGATLFRASKVVYSHPISDRMKAADLQPGLQLILAHTNTNFPPAMDLQPWLEVYLYAPGSAGSSSQIPVITSPTNAITLTNTSSGVDFPTYTITASNGPVGYDTSVLPAGLKFDPYTQEITGKLPAGAVYNPYQIQLFAYNSNGVGTALVPLFVRGNPNIGPPSNLTPTNATADTGTTYDLAKPVVKFAATNSFVRSTWSFSGSWTPSNPPGLSLTNQTSGLSVFGVLVGTPASGSEGTYTNTIRVSNNFSTIPASNVATTNFVLTIVTGGGQNSGPPGPFTVPPILGGVQSPGSFQITGQNTFGATWTPSNSVPNGISFGTVTNNGQVSGLLKLPGRGLGYNLGYTLDLTVSNDQGTSNCPVPITIGSPNTNTVPFSDGTLVLTQGTAVGSAGAFSNAPFNVTNNLSEADWTAPDDLPAGVTFSTQSVQVNQPQPGPWIFGRLGGTATETTFDPGTWTTNTNSYTFSVSNNYGSTSATVGLVIAPSVTPPSGPPSVNPSTNNVTNNGWVYIQPGGSNLAYATWSVTNLTLPPGLIFYTNLNLSGGRLGGVLAGQITNSSNSNYVVGVVASNFHGASTGNITINVASNSNVGNTPGWLFFPAMSYTGNVSSNIPAINPGSGTPTFRIPLNNLALFFVGGQVAGVTAVDSTLPPGLGVLNWPTSNGMTAQFTGRPTVAGNYTSQVTLSNLAGITNSNAVFTIQGPATPVITSSNTASGESGKTFAFPLTATPNAATFAASGLPEWLTLNSNSSPLGLIHGTVPAGYQGVWRGIQVWGSNAAGAGAKSPLTLTFTQGLVPQITSPATALATNGQPFSYTIQATNFPETFAASNRPSWLGAPNAVGLMTGTPTGIPSGTQTRLILYASNSAGLGQAPLLLTVTSTVAKPVVTSTTYPATNGVAFSNTLIASGSPTNYSIQPPLPANLTLNATSGVITGTPQSSGTNTFTAFASNEGGTGSNLITLAIAQTSSVPVITSTNAVSGRVGSAFRYVIMASNGPILSYQASNRPAWLSAPNAQGVMTGTPTNAQTNFLTLYASNAAGRGHQPLTITISSSVAPPVITSTTAVTATQGLAFSYKITASGKPTGFGAAPLPLQLSVNPATGVISGINQAVGINTITLSATNAGGVGTTNLVLTVVAKGAVPGITSAVTAQGTNNKDFRYQIGASNGPILSYGADNLPQGLSVNSSSGLITGKPWYVETSTVTLMASNRFGAGYGTLTLAVVTDASVPRITNDPGLLLGRQGYTFTPFTIMATGTPTPTYGASGLPGGLKVNPVSGVITGVPSTNGLFVANLLALNSAGTGTSPVAFIIEASPPVNPQITSPTNNVTLRLNQPWAYPITANNNPNEFKAIGLPQGLSVNPTNGQIGGRPEKLGNFNVSLEATRRVTGEPVTTARATLRITVQF